MPWCDTCDAYRAPNSLTEDGACRECDQPVTATTEVRKKAKIPWHFWVIVAFAGGYLGWRAIQGLMWLLS